MIDSDAIYNYTGKLKAIQRQFKGKEAKCVSDFIRFFESFEPLSFTLASSERKAI